MTVAFIGHRKVEQKEALKIRLESIVTTLIEQENADTFLFGSRSEFDSLCYEIVSDLKKVHQHIKRVYVRAEYEYIDKNYTDYLLTFYEETIFPNKVSGAGRLSYVKRNQVMVDMCDVAVVYCDTNYIPTAPTKSGTVMATAYAQQKKKRIINSIS